MDDRVASWVEAIVGLSAAAVLSAQGGKALRDQSASSDSWCYRAFCRGWPPSFFALVTPIDFIAEHLFAVHRT